MKNWKSDKPCVVCGESRDGYVTFHHIYTRKAYPEFENEPWNLMPMCQIHHNEIHSIGANRFAQKYVKAAQWFKDNGWEFRLSGKIYHD